MPRPSPPLLTFLGLLLITVVLAPPLHSVGARLRSESESLTSLPGTVARRNTNAFARILGELRMGAADYLFVKTELYLHGGIGYAAHTDDLDGEGASLAREAESLLPEDIQSLDEHAGHGHQAHAPVHDQDHQDHAGPAHAHAEAEDVRTTMRTAEDDFRGIIGNLEREIKPWRAPGSPHVLVGGAEMLPWFRLMTITNPHFIRGYRIGAMWLGREKKYDEALAFLQEGIDRNAENPELFLLYLSRVLMLTHKDNEGLGSHREEALAAAREGVRLGLAVRPEDGETGKIHAGLLWTADHAEDLLFLMRFEAILAERLGRPEEAIQALRTSRLIYPDDYPLQRIQERLLGR